MALPKNDSPLTFARLRAVLDYNPDDGQFTWLVTLNNRAPIGTSAGRVSSAGYREIGIDGKRYGAARLAHFWMTGAWSSLCIDHIDGDSLNDRWANLREATVSQNNANCKLRRGKLWPKGVRFHRAASKWGAYIKINKKQRHLGTFDTPEAAAAAYSKAANETFGEFARPAR